jgi:hypothetical protein
VDAFHVRLIWLEEAAAAVRPVGTVGAVVSGVAVPPDAEVVAATLAVHAE